MELWHSEGHEMNLLLLLGLLCYWICAFFWLTCDSCMEIAHDLYYMLLLPVCVLSSPCHKLQVKEEFHGDVKEDLPCGSSLWKENLQYLIGQQLGVIGLRSFSSDTNFLFNINGESPILTLLCSFIREGEF